MVYDAPAITEHFQETGVWVTGSVGDPGGLILRPNNIVLFLRVRPECCSELHISCNSPGVLEDFMEKHEGFLNQFFVRYTFRNVTFGGSPVKIKGFNLISSTRSIYQCDDDWCISNYEKLSKPWKPSGEVK